MKVQDVSELRWRRQAEVCFGLEYEELGDDEEQPWVCIYRVKEYKETVSKAETFRYVLTDVPDWISIQDRYSSTVDHKAVLTVYPFPKRMRDADGELWNLVYDSNQYQSEAECPEKQCCDDCEAYQELEVVRKSNLKDEEIWGKILAGDTICGFQVNKARMLLALGLAQPSEQVQELIYEVALTEVNPQDVSGVLDRYFHREGHLVEGKEECFLCEEKLSKAHGYVSVHDWTIAVYRHEPTVETELRRIQRLLKERNSYELPHHSACLQDSCWKAPHAECTLQDVVLEGTDFHGYQCPRCKHFSLRKRGLILGGGGYRGGLLDALQLDEVRDMFEEAVKQAYTEVIKALEETGNFRWLRDFFENPLDEDQIFAIEELLRVLIDDVLDAKRPYPSLE